MENVRVELNWFCHKEWVVQMVNSVTYETYFAEHTKTITRNKDCKHKSINKGIVQQLVKSQDETNDTSIRLKDANDRE